MTERKKSASERRAQNQASASAAYKKELEKFFSGQEVSGRLATLKDELKPEEGSAEAEWLAELDGLRKADFRGFVKDATAFVRAGKKFPNDEELLVRFLDHPSESITIKTLEHIVPILERKAWKKPAPLKNRLTTLSLAAEDPKTQALIAQIEAILG